LAFDKDIALIVAVPALSAVTRPFSSTTATPILLEYQNTDLFVAFSGKTVAENCVVPPTLRTVFGGNTVTLVTGTVLATHRA
jgi:hypothetical protein